MKKLVIAAIGAMVINAYAGTPRCAGNPDPVKCEKDEAALAAETPEQKAARIARLEAARKQAVDAVNKQPVPAKNPEGTTTWEYQTSADPMTSEPTKFATLESINSLDLDFPYKGKNTGQLTVRKSSKFGLNVIFSIDKGQILCRTYGDCTVMIRFDDAKPVRFSGVPPADHSSTSVFLENPQKFVTLASKAKRILVQATIYQNGTPVMEFQALKPLEWVSTKPVKVK